VGESCELKIKKSLFWDGQTEGVELNFLVLKNGAQVEIAPLNGVVTLEMTQSYINEWFV